MSNGRYDVIKPAAVSISPADDWQTVAIKAFDKAEDRRVREESEARAQGNLDREREDNLFNAKYTRAVADHENALREYELAINQIGKDNPEMLKAIQNKYSKEYLIPNRDGTFEKRYVVSDGVKRYTDEKIKSKSDFDSKVESWPEMTSEERIAAWPILKKHNKYFNVDLSTEEEGYKRALSSRDNEKVLESISAFLPTGYDANRWEGAKKILLKDGEVSEAELKLIAQDMTKHISTRDAARKFWTDFNTEIVKALADVKLDTPPSVVANLQRMQEMATQNLSEFYPDMAEATGRGKFNADVKRAVKEKYGKDVDFESLSSEEQQEIFTQVTTGQSAVTAASDKIKKAGITAGFETEDDTEIKEPLEEKVKPSVLSPAGKRIKNPVTRQYGWTADMMAKAVKESPFTYANHGLIPSDEPPGFKEVSIKEALQHYQKNKSKYKKDKPVKVSAKGLWPFGQDRPDKDLTLYPQSD